jgi:hypothetical protein
MIARRRWSVPEPLKSPGAFSSARGHLRFDEEMASTPLMFINIFWSGGFCELTHRRQKGHQLDLGSSQSMTGAALETGRTDYEHQC